MLLSRYSTRVFQRGAYLASQFILTSRANFSDQKNTKNGIITIQDETDFNNLVLNNPSLVIVDFYANWCRPCKLLTPRLENAILPHAGSILLAKVNIERLEELANEYKVSIIPTVIFMKNGKELDRFEGSREESFITKKINELIGQ